MKKIDRLVLKNFKAFRDQTFDFGGKNVLLYGNNGSGKSSLYWALYTFLQSSGKTNAQLQAYFQHFDGQNPDTYRSLKNVFAATDQNVEVEMTYVADDGTKTIKTISPSLINTIGDNVIQKANLASDFINYKLLQNFYNVTHKQEVNLWEVFWRDVFPYFEENGRSYREQIEALELASNGRLTNELKERLNQINSNIEIFLSQIEDTANQFLKQHFFDNKDVIKVGLKYQDKIDRKWIKARVLEVSQKTQIKLWVSVYTPETHQWIENHRPQSFLNEAQLTRIALAIRIGALLTRVQTTDFKILCLDDLLISLDMSNRRKVVKILLNVENNPTLAFFDDYQKIILTHDKGFFNMLKYFTTATEWKYFELQGDENGQNPPILNNHKGYLEKAEDFFNIPDFESAASYLRKEIEEIFKRYEIKKSEWDGNKQHTELKKKITEVKNKLTHETQQKFNTVFQNITVEDQLLAAFEKEDITSENLTPAQKGQLKTLRVRMKQLLQYQKTQGGEAAFLLNEAQRIVDFNLNANSHAATQPNYEEEIREAMATVKRLRDYFKSLG